MTSHCYNMLSTCSRCHQGCTILHVIAHLKEQNRISKTTKIKKNPWTEKGNESRNEHDSAIIHQDMAVYYGNCQGEIFHYQLKKNPNHSSQFTQWVLKKFASSNRLFKSKREVIYLYQGTI